MMPGGDGREPQGESLPFNLGFAVLLTAGAAFLQVAVYVLLAQLRGGGSPALVGMAAIVGYGTLFAFAIPRIPDPPGTSLGFLWPGRTAWGAMLFLLPSILLVSEADNMFQAIYPRPEGEGPEIEGFALLELAVVLIAVLPIIEELFFRGLIQPRLTELLGRAAGIATTAALAGVGALLIGGPWGSVVVSIEALVLGLLRTASGSVVPGLVLHMAFGLCSVLATAELFGIPGFDDISATHTPLEWLVPAALFTGIGLRLCRTLMVRQGTLPRLR